MEKRIHSLNNQKIFFKEWIKDSQIVLQNKWLKLVENKNFYSIDYHAEQVIVLPLIEKKYILLPKVK